MQNPVAITASGTTRVVSAGENTSPGVILVITASSDWSGTFKPQLENSIGDLTYTNLAYTNRLTAIPVSAGTTQSASYTMEIYGQPYRGIFITTASVTAGSLVVQAIPLITPSVGPAGASTLAADVAHGTFGANLGDTGAYAFAGALTITGVTTLSSAVTASSTLVVTGGLTASSALAVSGVTTLSSAVTASSTLAVTGVTTLSSAVTASSTLAVTGATTLSSATSFGNEATVTSSQHAMGFAVGAGSSATQGTSKVTAFTLNTATGQITFNNSALAGYATASSATWTCSAMQSNDIVTFQHISAGSIGAYTFNCLASAGSGIIYITNVSSASKSEAPVVRYYITRGAVA